jgi:hypothetical protein
MLRGEPAHRGTMESKDSVRAASQLWISAQRSPHRTSSFHHIRRSNSGYVRIFALYFCLTLATAYCCPLGFPMPGMSRPLPPVSGFPGLPGRALLRRVLRVRCPYQSIGDLSAYPRRRKLCVGSDVARTAFSISALGTLPLPFRLANRPGKHIPRR